jgi:DNA-binding NarL/FixJ family response regulator
VLLVSAHRERFQAVLAVLAELRPGLRLEWTRTSSEAARQLLAPGVRVVMVDAALADGGGRALLRILARWRPLLPVLVLAAARDAATPSTVALQGLDTEVLGAMARVGSWDELHADLDQALHAAPPWAAEEATLRDCGPDTEPAR